MGIVYTSGFPTIRNYTYFIVRPNGLQSKGCAANIRFRSEYQRIFTRFEANTTGLIRLFRIETNQRNLHAKRKKGGFRQYEQMLKRVFALKLRCENGAP
jgi:hypothetical protein